MEKKVQNKEVQITTRLANKLLLGPRRIYAELKGINWTLLSPNRISKKYLPDRVNAKLFAQVEGQEELFEIGTAEMFWLGAEAAVTPAENE